MTVTRGEVGRDNGRKRGKCCQGTCIKDPRTKPKEGRIDGGKGGWLWGGDDEEKMETTVLE